MPLSGVDELDSVLVGIHEHIVDGEQEVADA